MCLLLATLGTLGLRSAGNPPCPPSCASRRDLLHGATAAAVLGPTSAARAMVGGDREIMTTVKLPIPGREPIPVSRRRFTGAGDPSWTYPEAELPLRPFPASWPYSAGDFLRIDEDDDKKFYPETRPKLVYHIDEGAVAALTHYYDRHIVDGSDILDICSSWVSHYPRDFPSRMRSIIGTGISQTELSCNDQLSAYKQADLNARPKLPFADASFDVVTCVVSFDYLTKPLEVVREVQRVLRPGGRVILSQSNRCFYTKAVGAWTRDMSDEAHLNVLSTYLHFAGGLTPPRAIDITPQGRGVENPMFIVEAQRRG